MSGIRLMSCRRSVDFRSQQQNEAIALTAVSRQCHVANGGRPKSHEKPCPKARKRLIASGAKLFKATTPGHSIEEETVITIGDGPTVCSKTLDQITERGAA
jgi:hypothetical protein